MIFKEVEIKNPLYVATLDNGVDLFVYDGYAQSSNGTYYRPVEKETDGDYELIGWEISPDN